MGEVLDQIVTFFLRMSLLVTRKSCFCYDIVNAKVYEVPSPERDWQELYRGNVILNFGKKRLLESAEREMMPRQCRLIQPLVGVLLFLCLLGSIYLFVYKRFLKPNPSATIVRHSVETDPNEALKYWTTDKMRNAKPVDLPNVDTLDQGKRHPQRPSV